MENLATIQNHNPLDRLHKMSLDSTTPKNTRKTHSTAVLISTYNGEKFVRQQIASILEQIPEDTLILIRDDGSTDNTIHEIKKINDARISIEEGKNIGFGPSFMRLIQACPESIDIIMLADQDDVWLPDKYSNAVAEIKCKNNAPMLICTTQRLTDENLYPLEDTRTWPREPSFENALAENIVTGCTACFNNAALRILKKNNEPEKLYFHDWWIYLVISALGEVKSLSNPSLLYRQHQNNVIGHGAGWLSRQTKMVAFLIKHNWAQILLRQIFLLQKIYAAELQPSQKKLIYKYFKTTTHATHPKLNLIFSLRRWRQYGTHEIPFRILMLLEWLKSVFRSA